MLLFKNNYRLPLLSMLVGSMILNSCGIPIFGSRSSVRLGSTSINFSGERSVSTIDEPDKLLFRPLRTNIRGLPAGNDSYSRGFRAGCQTHMGIVGAGSMRLIPENIDPQQLSNDSMYFRGFNDGGAYCWARLDWDGT
jgi:hypothetical protein